MKKLLAAGILLSMACIANASPQTSDIQLPIPGDGVVAPKGGVIAVPLNSLLSKVYYTIECKVNNGNGQNVGMAFGFMMGGITTAGNFNLNGKTLGSSQGMLVAGLSNDVVSPTVYAYDTQGNEALTFENTDDTNSVTVSSCVAHFVTGK